MTERYAVVGNPVARSLSPRIHEAFAASTGQSLIYERLPAPVDGFASTVESFFAAGGAGLNVTVPFKEQAAQWVDELDAAARAAGAVNTICRVDGDYRGCNTDGAGLIRDLGRNLAVVLGGARVLLVGAGGAARGVTRPLLEAGVQCLVISNRTEPRARQLVEAARREMPGHDVRAAPFHELAPGFDVIINATSAGLDGDGVVPAIEPQCVRDAFCYDMIYGPLGRPGAAAAGTAFCVWASRHGARRTADGLGMLVEQAALAFELWRGVAPPTTPVLELLRSGDV